VNWAEHPAVPTGKDLTFGQRAADIMRNSMGSWPFVFMFLCFMLLWASLNMFWLGHQAFDPYPFILLNLLLSTLAGLQGAILLIAAKRADAIAAAQALHHLQISENTERLLTESHATLQAVHELLKGD
jgi:uncharacterized membrane protein